MPQSRMIQMFTFRNLSSCAALLSMVALIMTGCCCSGGSCPLFSGKDASPTVSSGSCDTCGTGATYSAPAQSYTMPTESYTAPAQSYSTQDFSTQQFSGSIPSAGSGTVNLPASAGSGTVNLPSAVQNTVQPSSGGGGFIPTVGGSASR